MGAISMGELMSGMGESPSSRPVSVYEAQREVFRIRVLLRNAQAHDPDQIPAAQQALRFAENNLTWSRLAPDRARRARMMTALTTPTSVLPGGEADDAWLARVRGAGSSALPRYDSYYGKIPSMVDRPGFLPPRLAQTSLARFSGQLDYSQYMRLQRGYPDLLRDWLRSGRVTLPAAVQFPGETGKGEQQRRQRAIMARRGTRVTRGPVMEPLRTASEVARLQVEEMAARGVRTYRPKSWVEERLDKPRTRGSVQTKQDATLRALTKGSAAFQLMPNKQKIAYLERIYRTGYHNNRKLHSMLRRYKRRRAKERSAERRMDRTGRELMTALEKKVPLLTAERDLNQEIARKHVAARRTRAWLNEVRRKNAFNAANLPGYDLVPHVGAPRRVARVRPLDVRAAAPLPQAYRRAPVPAGYTASGAGRPVTGGGVIYGQPYAQQARSGVTAPTSMVTQRPSTSAGVWF
jgi:hypothetical protein